jgi:hypothetical protein
MHSGKLWAPEGYGFTPECQGWWSLLVRQARMFRQMADRERQLDIALQRASGGQVRVPTTDQARSVAPVPGTEAVGAPTGEAGRAAEPTGPNLFLGHFGTGGGEKAGFHRGNQFTDYKLNLSVSTNKAGGKA